MILILQEVKGFISKNSVNTINVTCEARGRDELKEEVNDDKKEVLNLVNVGDQNTSEKDIKVLDCKKDLNNKFIPNQIMKEDVSKPALDKTCTKSSNVIDDCKDDILESSKEDDGSKYKLFIYNLIIPIFLTVDQVISIFTEYGVVTDCKRKKQTKRKIFYVSFDDENVCRKLESIGQIIVDGHRIIVRNISEVFKILVEFIKEEVGKTEIMDVFSKFGALKHCVENRHKTKNKPGFIVAFEDERVNKMLIEEGSVDYHGHKILIKEVFYIS